MTTDEILARVLYRDALMLVLDKPAGIAVHVAGPVRAETLDQHFDALRYGLPKRPELAHRLDRETSGCLVLGRHRKALADLGKLFELGKVEKIYLAVVDGGPPDDEGRIDLPLAKKDAQRGWQMKVDKEKGQSALTEYRVLARANGHSLVELNLHTGRTHQLRVHMAALGCPILGDRIYGIAGPMLHLHSWRVGVPLYPKRETIRATAPLPSHIAETLAKLQISFDESALSRV
jgi:tRNA pseudouridine32 synthase / 23S rRNA pseudouridine746 synthase